jgi:predicted nucleotidyltransferase
MSKICGLVCEFNPLHNGHKYLIDHIKSNKGTSIIAIMSGNYVQRGEPALIDKYIRTKMALLSGIDLVIELPVSFSCARAETFAYGGLSILNSLGIIDELWFGSECGNIKMLTEVSHILNSEDFFHWLSESKISHLPFAYKREKYIAEKLGPEYGSILSSPNNILAVEYLKAIDNTKSIIKPQTVNRAAGNSGLAQSTVSSSYIRDLMLNGKKFSEFVPEILYKTYLSIDQESLATIDNLDRALIYKLRTMDKADFSDIPDVAEGIENRIVSSAKEAQSVENLIKIIHSKRYTDARIKRILLSALLGITKKMQTSIPYFQVLGFNKEGERLLKSINSTIPFVTTFASGKSLNHDASVMFSHNNKCDELYGLFQTKIGFSDTFYHHPIIKI